MRNTFEVQSTFHTSINLLKDSIFNCYKENNSYSGFVLFRSLQEHYLRFKYFEKNTPLDLDVKESTIISENFAIKFKKFLQYSDEISYLVATNNLDNFYVETGVKNNSIAKNLIEDNYKLEYMNHDEFNKITWGIKSTMNVKDLSIKYHKYTGLMDAIFEQNVINYSVLSSYVHGGYNQFRTNNGQDYLDLRKVIFLSLMFLYNMRVGIISYYEKFSPELHKNFTPLKKALSYMVSIYEANISKE